MKEKRAVHKEHISSFHKKMEEKQIESELCAKPLESVLPTASDNDISDTFQKVVLPKKRRLEDMYKKNKKLKRDDNYIPYLPADKHTEEG